MIQPTSPAWSPSCLRRSHQRLTARAVDICSEVRSLWGQMMMKRRLPEHTTTHWHGIFLPG